MSISTGAFAPYQGFAQIAYVTNDYDKAVQQFGERYGVVDWMPLPDMEIQTGDGLTCRINTGLTYVGQLQLELIEPLGGDDRVYRSLLPEGGGARLHHIAQMLDTEAELDAARLQAEAANAPIALTGELEGLIRYFYTDHRDTLGHYIEHVWYAPAGRELFEHIPRN